MNPILLILGILQAVLVAWSIITGPPTDWFDLGIVSLLASVAVSSIYFGVTG